MGTYHAVVTIDVLCIASDGTHILVVSNHHLCYSVLEACSRLHTNRCLLLVRLIDGRSEKNECSCCWYAHANQAMGNGVRSDRCLEMSRVHWPVIGALGPDLGHAALCRSNLGSESIVLFFLSHDILHRRIPRLFHAIARSVVVIPHGRLGRDEVAKVNCCECARPLSSRFHHGCILLDMLCTRKKQQQKPENVSSEEQLCAQDKEIRCKGEAQTQSALSTNNRRRCSKVTVRRQSDLRQAR